GKVVGGEAGDVRQEAQGAAVVWREGVDRGLDRDHRKDQERIDANPGALLEGGADELAGGVERDPIALGDDRRDSFDVAVGLARSQAGRRRGGEKGGGRIDRGGGGGGRGVRVGPRGRGGRQGWAGCGRSAGGRKRRRNGQ